MESNLTDGGNLALLFKNNQKIFSVSLKKLNMINFNVSDMNYDSITELHFSSSIDRLYLKDFFTKLKNLKVIKIKGDVKTNKIIIALNEGDCVNIREISIQDTSEANLSKLYIS